MQLTVTGDGDTVFSVDVEPSEILATVKTILEVETGIPTSDQRLLFNGALLKDNVSLAASGVRDGDLLVLTRAPDVGTLHRSDANPMAMNRDGSPANQRAMMEHIRGNEGILREFAAINPDIPRLIACARELQPSIRRTPRYRTVHTISLAVHSKLLAGDTAGFSAALRAIAEAQAAEGVANQQAEIDMMNADPTDLVAQAKIAEHIRQVHVAHNYSQAMENNPEVFVQVEMLYVQLEVNGHPVKAFIDSGAQMTLMGAATAESLGVMHLLDKRFHGMAMGVGTGKILGKIHSAPMKVGDQFLTSSISIMENDDMHFLFGLDMLRRHQCQIDLAANVLRFTNLGIALPFLQGADLPTRTPGVSGAGPSSAEATDDAAAMARAGEAATARAAAASAGGASTHSAAGGSAASAAGPTAVPSASVAAPSLPSTSGGEESKVLRLMGLGFDRALCTQAIAVCDGNEERAASFLFDSSMGF